MSADAGRAGTIERLYALNAGYAVQPDRSVYTPGKWQGEQIILTCNAYLIRRAGAWILWDTGTDDAIETLPGGQIIAHNLRAIVVRSIRKQLEDIGLTPSDIQTVLLSHAHFDHVGNARLFEHAKWYLQRREFDAMFGADPEAYGYSPSYYDFLERADVTLMDGDADVVGDGSVKVIDTPGHTPGHCSLLVHLANAGPIILSADVAHYRYNLEHHCVPAFNHDAELSRQSMQRIQDLVAETGAQLWLNHDSLQSASTPHAPAFID